MNSRSKRRTGSTKRRISRESTATRVVRILQKETNGYEEDVYAILAGIIIAMCMSGEQPITKAQEVCGDIQRHVTELVMGEVEDGE